MIGNGIEINQRCTISSLFDEFTYHFHDSKLRVIWIQHRWMTKEIENRALLDSPAHAKPNRAKKISQFPSRVAERADVANRVHWNINQPVRINKRLRCVLGCDDAIQHLGCRRFAWRSIRMG